MTKAESLAQRRWYIVDAEGKVLGRMATEIARVLRGKHKPSFSPHLDAGDFVIVVNAKRVKVTGAKENDKRYYRHSGYPGRAEGGAFVRDAGQETGGDCAVGGQGHAAEEPAGTRSAR